MRKKWEYHAFQFVHSDMDILDMNQHLGYYGKEGWELVSVTQYKMSPGLQEEIYDIQISCEELNPENKGFTHFTAFFKREIID